MRTVSIFASLLFALATIACQPAAEAPAPSESPAMSDEDMLKAQTDAFVAAWNAADAGSIAALFAAEGNIFDPAGEEFAGQDAIRERYQEMFQTIYQGTQLSITTTSTRFLEPTVAVIDGKFQIAGMKSQDGGELPAVTGLFTNVAVKHGENWHLHSVRPMMPLPAPPAGT